MIQGTDWYLRAVRYFRVMLKFERRNSVSLQLALPFASNLDCLRCAFVVLGESATLKVRAHTCFLMRDSPYLASSSSSVESRTSTNHGGGISREEATEASGLAQRVREALWEIARNFEKVKREEVSRTGRERGRPPDGEV